MNLDDLILESKITDLKNKIQAWGVKRKLWTDTGFKTHYEHYEDEPSEYGACVLILWSEGGMNGMLAGYSHSDFLDEFDAFMDGFEFYYERLESCVYGFYAKEEDLNEAYLKYFEWQWVTELIKPDYTSLYQEVFEYFNKNPKRLYLLSSRKFEILISEVFKNQGFRSELGKGQNDGGVDIRLYKKDEIDEIVTLVQVKKYKPGLPIDLQAVSSLTAIVNQENANRGLFVTTSRYLPVAQRFATRESTRLTLANAEDVSRWCANTSNLINRDKSVLLEDVFLLALLKSKINNGLVGKIVVANNNYGMITNDFCLVVKETSNVILLMRISSIPVTEGNKPAETRGYEIPILNEQIVKHKTKEDVFRAQKKIDLRGEPYYWGHKNLYTLWDGTPQYYDLND